jgi:hypothetical protein
MLAVEKLSFNAVFSASMRLGVPADGALSPSDAIDEKAMLPELSTDTITFGAGSLTAALRGVCANGYCAAWPTLCVSTRPHAMTLLDSPVDVISLVLAMFNSPW